MQDILFYNVSKRKITTHKTFEKMNEQDSRQVMESCSSHQQKVEIKGT